MGDAEQFVIRTLRGIDAVSAPAWDACANPGGETPYDPFLRHAFLHALEASGSATPEAGWVPVHTVIEDTRGRLVGAVPLYVKSHSRGEYVFDHAWADAFHRAGGRYYPKLLAAVPFTPVTGRRLLVRPGDLKPQVEAHLVAGCIELARRIGASSVHFNFPTETEWRWLGERGFLRRMDQQFHWRNAGYRDFDDFLSELSSKKRKNLKRERRLAVAPGVRIERLTGADLREAHWDAFFRFYRDTGERKWGSPYLTRKFFRAINETMADDVLLVMCERDGRYVAGALNFIGGKTLYGRNWGCIENHPFLHFETCYYQAIEFAIERGLETVEAGAQGPHKIARGYRPVATHSAHWIADPGLEAAVEEYLREERRYVGEEIEYLRGHAPFRRAGGREGSDFDARRDRRR